VEGGVLPDDCPARRASQSSGDHMSFDTSTLYLIATMLAAMNPKNKRSA